MLVNVKNNDFSQSELFTICFANIVLTP